jgi:hypothetical protein
LDLYTALQAYFREEVRNFSFHSQSRPRQYPMPEF